MKKEIATSMRLAIVATVFVLLGVGCTSTTVGHDEGYGMPSSPDQNAAHDDLVGHVVRITCHDADDRPTSSGNGFWMPDSDLFITAAHVIDGASYCSFMRNGSDDDISRLYIIMPLGDDEMGKRLTPHDLALWRIAEVFDEKTGKGGFRTAVLEAAFGDDVNNRVAVLKDHLDADNASEPRRPGILARLELQLHRIPDRFNVGTRVKLAKPVTAESPYFNYEQGACPRATTIAGGAQVTFIARGMNDELVQKSGVGIAVDDGSIQTNITVEQGSSGGIFVSDKGCWIGINTRGYIPAGAEGYRANFVPRQVIDQALLGGVQ